MATLLAPSRGDRAFERLYRRYVADVYRYVLAVLQNEDDAEDATQTAFLSAYRAFERGERPERPHNWLIKIAHNVCRQRFRESARRPHLVELEHEVAARAPEEEAPRADEIRQALGFLAFNQRAALVMRELQGRSYGEIADILGLSTSAVETLLFRARRALREQLEGDLSCGEVELALSRRLDGELPLGDRGPLRAHLRECPECAALERRARSRRRALRHAAFVPVPGSLGSLFGGGVAGTGVAAKAAAVVVAGVLGGGLAGDAIERGTSTAPEPTTALAAPVVPSGATPAESARVVGHARPATRSRKSSPRRFTPQGPLLQATAPTPAAQTPAPQAASQRAEPSASPALPVTANVPIPDQPTPGASSTPPPPVATPPVATPPVATPPVSAPPLPPPTPPQPTVPELPEPSLPQVDLPKPPDLGLPVSVGPIPSR